MTRGLPPLHESWLPSEHSLYRPRHSPRQRTSLLVALVFFGVPLLLFAVGVRPPAMENREPAAFPSMSSGWGLFTGLDAWATDQFPLRKLGVSAADAISRGVFREAPQFGKGREDMGPIPPAGGEPDEKAARRAGPEEVIEGRDGWLYLGYDITGACDPIRSSAEVVTALQRLRKAVESSGRELVLVVAPNKSTMVPEFLPDEWQRECAIKAREKFWNETAPTVGAVDLRSALADAAVHKGAPIYPAADTHWMHEGALAMTRGIAETVQPGVSETWRITPGSVKVVPADIPPLLGREVKYSLQTYDLAPDGQRVRDTPIQKPFRKEILHFTREPGPGAVTKKVAMIADSFSEPAIQYLGAAFTDIRIAHVERVGADLRGTLSELADSDVLVVEGVERFFTGGNHPLLSSIAVDHIEAELAKHPR